MKTRLNTIQSNDARNPKEHNGTQKIPQNDPKKKPVGNFKEIQMN